MKSRYRIRVVFVLMLLVASPANSVDHALLIGVSNYATTSGYPNLKGPINDIGLIRELLIQRFGTPTLDIRQLADQAATYDRLRAEIGGLAKRAKDGDQVYIHFSGYGSLVEPSAGRPIPAFVLPASKLESEARRPTRVSLPELTAWLGPIAEKGAKLIFVSDAGHESLWIADDGPRNRAVSPKAACGPDTKAVTDSNQRFPGIHVSAAGLNGLARDGLSRDDRSYGWFTWYWVKALQAMTPDATWHQAFEQADKWLQETADQTRHAAFAGARDIRLTGYSPPRARIKGAGTDQRSYLLDLGQIHGVTVGSTYRKLGEGACAGQPGHLRVTEVELSQSRAEGIPGEGVHFDVGDPLCEVEHAFHDEKYRVFLAHDEGEPGLWSRIKKGIEDLDAYEIGLRPDDSDYVLRILCPSRDASGVLIDPGGPAGLPRQDEQSAPELWLLGPEQRLLSPELYIGLDNPDRTLLKLVENLRGLARFRDLKRLANNSGGRRFFPAVRLELRILRPSPDCKPPRECLEIPDRGFYEVTAPFDPQQAPERSMLHRGEILSFVFTSNEKTEVYYLYLLNLTPDLRITSVFPHWSDPEDIVRLTPGGKLDLFELGYGLFLEMEGTETMKVILSDSPIAAASLQTESWRTRSEQGDLNPLERLLDNALTGRRGIPTVMPVTTWGTMELELEVE